MINLASVKVRASIAVALLIASVTYLLSRDNCCSVDRELLLAAAAIQPVNLAVFVVVALRFALLARPARPRIWSCLKGSILAAGINIMAPARGGDFLRITYLRHREDVPLGTGISISMIERVADLIVLLTLAIVVVNQELLESSVTPLISALAVVGIGLLALISSASLITKVVHWVLPGTIAEFIGAVLSETESRIRDGKFFLALGASAVFFGLGLIATTTFFGIATGRDIPISLSLAIMVFATLGGAIPILPGGLATFEAGAMLALIYGGFTPGESLQLAVAFRLQQFIVATPVAILIVARERLGLSAMMSEIYELVVERRGPPKNAGVPSGPAAEAAKPENPHRTS